MEKQRIKNFDSPTANPFSDVQAKEWQDANRFWWEAYPMRYDWKATIPFEEFTREFYLEIDKRFFNNTRDFLIHPHPPFCDFINFESLKSKDVLEIGVGNGSHAQLLTQYANSFTGIDITDYAVKSTERRLQVFDLRGEILKMDAEELKFNDQSFDFVWAWGVLHHSSNTARALKEIWRVLRPGGETIIMVYHRGWWNYYLCGILQGFVSGTLLKTKSLHKSVQCHTDGAIARYYSIVEWEKIITTLFSVKEIKIFGPKTDVLLLPNGKLKALAIKLLPNAVNRFLTTNLRMGSFLMSRLRKTEQELL